MFYFGYFPEIIGYHFHGISTPHSTLFLVFYFGYFPKILTHNLIALFCIVADVLAASVMSGKLNGVAFKIILVSMHDDPCVCTCGFCDQDCKTIKRVSPSFLMSHMFVPAPFSSLSLLLFCTNGIVYATGTLGTTSIF